MLLSEELAILLGVCLNIGAATRRKPRPLYDMRARAVPKVAQLRNAHMTVYTWMGARLRFIQSPAPVLWMLRRVLQTKVGGGL